jgi:hypothetical protein
MLTYLKNLFGKGKGATLKLSGLAVFVIAYLSRKSGIEAPGALTDPDKIQVVVDSAIQAGSGLWELISYVLLAAGTVFGDRAAIVRLEDKMKGTGVK